MHLLTKNTSQVSYAMRRMHERQNIGKVILIPEARKATEQPSTADAPAPAEGAAAPAEGAAATAPTEGAAAPTEGAAAPATNDTKEEVVVDDKAAKD